jgi:hypothetical protein
MRVMVDGQLAASVTTQWEKRQSGCAHSNGDNGVRERHAGARDRDGCKGEAHRL